MVSWCDLTNEDEEEEEQGEGAERGEGGGGLSNRCVVNDLVTGVRGLGAPKSPKCTLLPSVPSQVSQVYTGGRFYTTGRLAAHFQADLVLQPCLKIKVGNIRIFSNGEVRNIHNTESKCLKIFKIHIMFCQWIYYNEQYGCNTVNNLE